MAALHLGTLEWSLPEREPPRERGPTPTWRATRSSSTSAASRVNGRVTLSAGSGASYVSSSTAAVANSRTLLLCAGHEEAGDVDPSEAQHGSASLGTLVVPASMDPRSPGNPPVSGGAIIRPRRHPPAVVSERGKGEDEAAAAGYVRRLSQWNTWWVEAVAAQNTEALEMLARMPWSDTAIIISSMRMMHEPRVFQSVVELIVAQRPDEIETRESVGGLTALAWAAKKGNCAAIRPLVAAGANLNSRDDSGSTPVLHAAVSASVPAMEVLIEAGADVNATAKGTSVACRGTTAGPATGWSPLTWTARKGQLTAMRLLLGAGADVNARGGAGGATPMIQAAMGGHVVGRCAV